MDLPLEVNSGASDLRIMIAVGIPDGGEVDLRLPNGSTNPAALLRLTSTGATLLSGETDRRLPGTEEIQFDDELDETFFHDCHFLAIEEKIVVFVDGNFVGHVVYTAGKSDALRIGTHKMRADFADLRISEVREKGITP